MIISIKAEKNTWKNPELIHNKTWGYRELPKLGIEYVK